MTPSTIGNRPSTIRLTRSSANLAPSSCEASDRRAGTSVQFVLYLPRLRRHERGRYTVHTCPAGPLPATPADWPFDPMTLHLLSEKSCHRALVSTVEVIHRVREGLLLGVAGRRIAISRRQRPLLVTRFLSRASFLARASLLLGRLG